MIRASLQLVIGAFFPPIVTLEAVLQLRGQAGALQIPKARKALVQSWRGIPTATGAVAVLGN